MSKSNDIRAVRRAGPCVMLAAVALAAPTLLVPLTAGAQRKETFEPPPPSQEPRRAPRSERDKSSPKDGKAAEAAPPKPIPKSLRPPGGSPVPYSGAARAQLLGELYAHLATAESEETGTRVATAIEHVWATQGGDTVKLLIERAQRAVDDKKPEMALRLLDRAALLAPDYPEVFNRRAALYFGQNNVASSIGDLRRVLALEPNHFRAMEALASIFKELGRKKAALEVYRKLFEIHPQMPSVKSTFEELEREVSGQGT